MTEQNNKIEIRNLSKIFGPKPQSHVAAVEAGMSKADLLSKHGHVLGLDRVDLDIPTQRLQVVMGLSGSGKSTLIRHINRLIEPTIGELRIDGEDVLTMGATALRDLRRNKVSMVFQKFALLPNRSVFRNVAYGLELRGVDKAQLQERTQCWVERVGLEGFENSLPSELSGGMQQRVGLARALATDCDVLLMDEAFSALDPLIRNEMQDVLLDLQRELNKTIVFITHDLDEALRIGDRIAILRDGGLVQQGTPADILLKPADAYVRAFVRDINRGRALKLASILPPTEQTQTKKIQPGENKKPTNGLPTLQADCSLEDALHTLIKTGKKRAHVKQNDALCGAITLEQISSAMQRGDGEN